MKKTRLKKVSAKQELELAVRRKIKAWLIFKYGNKCMICGKRPDWRGLSLSHKKSLAQGGVTQIDNVELLCGRCHSKEHHIKEAENDDTRQNKRGNRG